MHFGIKRVGQLFHDCLHVQIPLGPQIATPPVAFVPVKPASLRPKSASAGARHSNTSQHRMELIQAALSKHNSNNNNGNSHSESHNANALSEESNQRSSSRPAAANKSDSGHGITTTAHHQQPQTKQDDARRATETTPRAPLAKMPTSLLRPGSRLGKRPLSAVPVSIFNDHNASSPATSTNSITRISSRPEQKVRVDPPKPANTVSTVAAMRSSTTGLKRPYSAAPFCLSQPASSHSTPPQATSLREAKEERTVKKREPEAAAEPQDQRGTLTNNTELHCFHRLKVPHPCFEPGSSQLRPANVAITSSYHRSTFIYAVPLHCLESGRQYNPYNIVTLSHVRPLALSYVVAQRLNLSICRPVGRALWRQPAAARGQVRLLHDQRRRLHVPPQRRRLPRRLPLDGRLGAPAHAV